MAQFPIQYTTATPSGRTTGVRANLDTDTGMDEVGRSLSQFGQTISAIREQLQVAKDDVELSTLRRRYDEIGNETYKALELAPSQEAADEVEEGHLKNISTLQGSNARVNAAFQKYKDTTDPEWEKTFIVSELKRTKDQGIAGVELNAAGFIKNGDLGSALKEADSLKNFGVSQVNINKYKEKLNASYGDVLKNKGYEAAVSAIEKGKSVDEAIDAGKGFIPAEERQEFESEIQAIALRLDSKRTEEFKSNIHEVLNLPPDDFLTKWRGTRDAINSRADIDTATKETLLKKGDSRLEALASGKVDPIEIIDAMAVRAIRNEILKNPAKVASSDITGLNAPSWAKEDLIKLKASLESGEMPLEQRRALQSMDRIRELRKKYEDTAFEEGIEKSSFEATSEFIKWSMSEEGRSATPEQVEKKLKYLTKPVAEKMSLNLAQRFLTNTFGEAGAFIGLPKAFRVDTPEEQLADEHKGELKRLGIWDELTEEEKADVYKGLKSGRTAQEFVDIYYAE